MEDKMWTTKQVAEYFGMKDTKIVTQKFIKQGLKFIRFGKKDYRYDPKDVEAFKEYLKELAQEKVSVHIQPVKRKYPHKRIDLDFEKKRINIEMNRVV